MSDVTRLLNAIAAGQAEAAEELLPLVYEELRVREWRARRRDTPHRRQPWYMRRGSAW